MMQIRPTLIIDDDPMECELVTAILGGAGFKVLTATDGPKGIAMARVAQPAVILVDMMMPGLDGISTCEHLRRDPILRDIPVIGITASADLKVTEQAFRAGASFFLPKPFSAESLLHVVRLAGDTAAHQRKTPGHHRPPRFAIEVPVHCIVRRASRPPSEISGHTGNISLGGLLLELPEILEPGTACRLRLDIPDGPVPAEGRVVWQYPNPAARNAFRHGIQLLRFPDDIHLVQYRRFLSQIATDDRAQTRP